MALLDWFRRVAGAPGGDAAAPAEGDRAAEIDGLNFMTAIDAHVKWKTRLEQYIEGRGEENLRIEQVARDDRCPLGLLVRGDYVRASERVKMLLARLFVQLDERRRRET